MNALAEIGSTVLVMKVAVASVIALVMAGVTSLRSLSAAAAADPTSPAMLIPAGTTLTSGALLAFVVYQIVNGKLVNADHAMALSKLTDAVERSNELAAESQRREDLLTDLLRGTGPE